MHEFVSTVRGGRDDGRREEAQEERTADSAEGSLRESLACRRTHAKAEQVDCDRHAWQRLDDGVEEVLGQAAEKQPTLAEIVVRAGLHQHGIDLLMQSM